MIRRPPRSKRIDTLVPYPTLFRFLAHLGRIAARRVDLQADVEIPAVGADGKSEAAVIIGFGRVGRLVAEMLSTHGRAYIAVDSNIDTVAAARREGYPVMFGDVSRPALVDKLKLGQASALILTMDEPVLSVRLVRKVRGWCPALTIVARARDRKSTRLNSSH